MAVVARVSRRRDRSVRVSSEQAKIQPQISQVPSQVKGAKLPPELRSGFERAYRASMRLSPTTREAAGTIVEDFGQQFADKAANRRDFHALMKQVYGKGYDAERAEAYRQLALEGDTSWMPEVRFVDGKTLGGAHGAYDAESGIVYLNSALAKDPSFAAQVYAEEFGHFLDTQLRSTDSAGDEGELFRRLLSGEKLSRSEIAVIRAENDHGVITVDGRRIEVEFWNPFKAVAKAVKKVGSAIGGAVKGIAKGIGRATKTVFGSIARLGKGLFSATGALLRGDFSGAGRIMLDSIDKAIFQLPSRLSAILYDASKDVLDSVTPLLGQKIGGFLNKIGTGLIDAGRGISSAALDIGRTLLRSPLEAALGLGSDVLGGIGLILRGRFKEGLGRMVKAPWNAGKQIFHDTASAVVRSLVGVADVIDALFGIGAPPRALTADEKAYFRQIYGDTIDLDQVRIKRGGLAVKLGNTARVVGNTVYMPDNLYDGQGNLTTYGRSVLDHEMGHVWQHQNGGLDYVSKALTAQALGYLSDGDRGAAYNWRQAYLDGTQFEDLNPEEQAQLIQFVTQNLSTIESGGLVSDPNGRITDAVALTEYLRRALQMIRAGQGAP